jgi:hypothetical protein
LKLRSLFDRPASYGGLYAMLFVNRIQMLYLFLLIPTYLVQPYMVWGIVGIGLVSQIILLAISRWLSSEYAGMGYEGYVRLFGRRTVRWLAAFGLVFLLVKISVFTLGAVEITHQYIFPSMSPYLLIAFVFLAGCYLAAHGIDNLVRFVVIVFLSTFWIILIFVPFFLPPFASVTDLYPLVPAEWTIGTWNKLLFMLGTMSGPEYLVCLAPWIRPTVRRFPYWTLGGLLSVLEYGLLFAASLMFYGSEYLSKTKHPVVNMLRYQQSPVFERIDIILISNHLFNFIYFIAFFLLFIYGSVRTAAGRKEKRTSPFGFWMCCGCVLVLLFVVYKWFWEVGTKQSPLITLQLWLGTISFVGVPLLLLLTMKRKGRASG